MNVHLWETVEIELNAEMMYQNPYTDVDVWADLSGPGFNKKVYGFWDGGNTFRIRICATKPGTWTYITNSNTDDPGLTGQSGTMSAADWTEAEKKQNPCRRGLVIASENGHAFKYADGTPVYILADTEWSLFTNWYPWQEDALRSLGPNIGFKDVIRQRRSQGFNAVATIAAFPGWQDDGLPSEIMVDSQEGIYIRSGWPTAGTSKHNNQRTIRDMANEGGYPFMFPGKIPGYEHVFPDMDQINPDYFQYVDRKMKWLNEQGFTVFIEAVRRDCSTAWKKYHPWPDSYARFVHYLYCRYQTSNCLFSPIHTDSNLKSISTREYNEPANLVVDKYGPPPFGTLCGTNAHGTSLANFGHTDEARWLTFHQIGNNYGREHDHYWYLTQIYHVRPAVPALNGEPYYPGDRNGNGRDQIQVAPDCEEANLRFRSALYGNLLSGGYAGFFYGAEGMWGGDREIEARYKQWDALQYESGYQVQHIKEFLKPLGDEYQNLVPNADLVTPNKMGEPLGYKGWAFCSYLPEKQIFLLYFEKYCPQPEIRGLEYESEYEISWFNPREGIWLAGTITRTNEVCRLIIPDFPDENDWGMLVRKI